MNERMRFVIRLKDGESMASLWREFGIFRKTGYNTAKEESRARPVPNNAAEVYNPSLPDIPAKEGS